MCTLDDKIVACKTQTGLHGNQALPCSPVWVLQLLLIGADIHQTKKLQIHFLSINTPTYTVLDSIAWHLHTLLHLYTILVYVTVKKVYK